MRTSTSATGRIGGVCFTIIELLVVVAILGIAAGAIIPRMGRSLEHRDISEAGARFVHTARVASELAAAQQREFAIRIDLDRGRYEVAVQGEGGQMQTVRASYIKAGGFGTTTKIEGLKTPDGAMRTTGIAKVTFFPDGRCSGASLQLLCDERRYIIVIHSHNGRAVFSAAEDVGNDAGWYDLGD